MINLDNLLTIKQNKNKDQRIIGIDWGMNRIGIAISDPMWIISDPLCILQRYKCASMIDSLNDICTKYNTVAAIIGQPLNEDGSKSDQCKNVERFAEAFYDSSKIPYLFWDEYGTSNLNLRRNIKRNDKIMNKISNKMSNKIGNKMNNEIKYIDDISANIILSEVLNKLK